MAGDFPKRGDSSFVIAIEMVGLLSLGEIGYILHLYIIQNCMSYKYFY